MATGKEDKPIWVLDLLAWLEKIGRQDEEHRAERVKEVLADLPGHGLPEEYWVNGKGSDGAENNEIELQSLSDEDRDGLRQELENLHEIEDEDTRAKKIVLIARKIPTNEPLFLKAVFMAANKLETSRLRSSTFAVIFSKIPVVEFELVIEQALRISERTKDNYVKLELIVSIIDSIPILAKVLRGEAKRLLQIAVIDATKEIADKDATIKEVASRTLNSDEQQLYQQNQLDLLKKDLDDSSARDPDNNSLWEKLMSQAAIDHGSLSDSIRSVSGYSFWWQFQDFVFKDINFKTNLQKKSIYSALLTHNESCRLESEFPKGTTNSQFLHQFLDAAIEIHNECWRSESIAKVAFKNPKDESEILRKAVEAAKEIKIEKYRLQVIASVVAEIPTNEKQLLNEVLELAKNFSKPQYKLPLIAEIATKFHDSERQLIVQKALEDHDNAYKTSSSILRKLGSRTAIIAKMPVSDAKLLNKALNAADSCINEEFRSYLIATFASQIPSLEDKLILQIVQSAKKLKDKKHQIIAMSGIGCNSIEFILFQIAQSEISIILETVPRCKSSIEKAKFLSALAPRLFFGLFDRALQLIQEINHPKHQAEALSNLVPYLPAEQLTEALDLIKNHITGFTYPTTALCHLIPRLSFSQLQQALVIAFRRIKQLHLLAQILQIVAVRLCIVADDQTQSDKRSLPKRRFVKHILNRTLHLIHEKSIANILIAIAPSLDLSQDADKIAAFFPPSAFQLTESKLKSESYRAQVLAAIAPKLSSDKQITLFLEQVKYLTQEQPKATAISAFISFHPNKQDNLIDPDKNLKVIDVVKSLKKDSENNLQRNTDLAIIFATRPHSPNQTELELAKDQTKLLRLIRQQSLDHDKARYLIHLSPYLLSSQIQEAQSLAQEIGDDYHQAKTLTALSIRFPQVRPEARTKIDRVKDKIPKKDENEAKDKYLIQHLELIAEFAIIVPEEIPHLLKSIEEWDHLETSTIENELLGEDRKPVTDPNRKNHNRTLILKAIKPHLPIRLSREIDRETSIGKAPQDLWDRSLFVLRNEYRQALKSGSLRNDAAQDEDLLDIKDEINALTEMLLMRDLTPPVAVGILGGWGGGKSYIMHLMQTHMVEIRSRGLDQVEAWGFKNQDDKNPDSSRLNRYVGHIYQIKFDAWTYAKSDLWASLMQTIFFELDRQISLETALRDIGIAPLDKEGNKIWEVLYKTNEEDRKYLIEKALGKDSLKELQAKSEEEKESWTGLLWQQYGVKATNARTDLSKNQNELEIVVSKLNELKKQKKTINNAISDDHKSENWISEVLTETTKISGFLLKRYFDKNVADALETEINNKLKAAKVDISDLNKMNALINKTVAEILEEDQIKLDDGKTKYSLSWVALKKWLKKNQKLIIAFMILTACSIIFPFIAHHINSQNIISQIAALIAPLIPAIGLAQTLYKSNQKWFTQAEQSIREYQETLKTCSENKYHNLVDEKNTNQLRDIEKEVNQLIKQQKNLEQAVEKAKSDLPPDKFSSLASFVSATVGESSYDKKLGIMHQVKDDLTKLSQALLPPPIDSEEYKEKLVQLQNIFPRGTARVVLYIDDLDRCPPKTVVEVLEAVQLLVKNPLFIAVLSIDERYITRALADHYKGVLPLKGRPSASDYLEKIIQIPYRIRPISEQALRQYLRAQIVVQDSETSGTKFNEFSPEEFNLLVACCKESELSPRSLKRLTNVYKLYKVLSRTRGQKPTPKEQKTILTLLAFSSRYPDLMRDILQKIGSIFEQSQNADNKKETLFNVFKTYLEDPSKNGKNSYLAEDVKQLAYDVEKLVDKKLELNEIRSIFDFVRTFSFVGDIGVDHK